MSDSTEMYTVFVDGKLWIEVIDDVNSNASWAIGGIIFTSLQVVHNFIENLRKFEMYKDSDIKIMEIKHANTQN